MRYPKQVSDDIYLRTVPLMGTFVTIKVLGHGASPQQIIERSEAAERAFEWFHRIEECCTRFEPQSEVMQLAVQPGVAVTVSAILYEAVQFALAVAAESNGAFDPTVGYAMETRGFNREYHTGHAVRTALEPDGSVSYRDVRLDPDRRTITLLRPLIIDLGAVAKGLAIDLAARELRPFENFSIDAGGDLYLGGRNSAGEQWSVGVRHPRRENELLDSFRVSNKAVCTSGDYERKSPRENNGQNNSHNNNDDNNDANGHHILDPQTGTSARAVASVTVVAPTAMLADALATAAFVLGPAEGIQLFARLGVDGLIVSPALERYSTKGMPSGH